MAGAAEGSAAAETAPVVLEKVAVEEKARGLVARWAAPRAAVGRAVWAAALVVVARVAEAEAATEPEARSVGRAETWVAVTGWATAVVAAVRKAGSLGVMKEGSRASRLVAVAATVVAVAWAVVAGSGGAADSVKPRLEAEVVQRV